MELQKRKTWEKKQKIFKVALELFYKQGFTQTTINDIRVAAGVSVGSLYHHFNNKEVLADQLYLETVRGFCQSGISAIESSKNPKSLIKCWISFHFAWFQKEKIKAHFMMNHQTKPLQSIVQEGLTTIQTQFFTSFAEALTEVTTKGKVTTEDPSLFFFTMIGPTESLSRVWLLNQTQGNLKKAELFFIQAAQASLISGG